MQEMQTTLPTGSIIGDRYRVEDLLGQGGFSAVYLVRDLRVRQNIFALKEIVNPAQRDRRHFTFEVDLLRRVEHPSLPRVYRAFEDSVRNSVYMLMDYIEGPNLEQLRRRRPGQRLALSEVFSLVGPIVEAVIYLHTQEPPIIHRDIKPSNIIAPVSGERTVLVDFGIAKEFAQDATTSAIRLASPGYGAPEQYSTGTDTRTDVYGLGATIYALLTGMVPTDAFVRMTQSLTKNIDPLPPAKQLVPDLPEEVSAALRRAMALDSEERFASVKDFWAALQAAVSPELAVLPVDAVLAANKGEASKGGPVSVVPAFTPPKRSRSRRRLLAIFLLFLLALGLGFASAFLLLPGLRGQVSQTSAATPGGVAATHRAGLTPVHTSVPTVTATATATATPMPKTPGVTATPVATLPALASDYNGTIHDNNGNITTSMALTAVMQQQANIQGNFIVGTLLSGNGPFTGSVAPNDTLKFIVHSSDANVHAPLYFTGAVAKDGSLSGSYCSLNTSGVCDPLVGGYGSWSAQPVNGGS